MADEANIPTHRWYQNRNHIKLPMQDVSESVIKAAGIAKIDQFMITTASNALFAAGEVGVWYDPSDLTTLFQDSAGTTPVTAAGQPVGLMLDKSGRGNHATQATAAQRPTYGIHPYSGVRNVANGSADVGSSLYWPSTKASNGVTATKGANGVENGVPWVEYRYTGTPISATVEVGFADTISRNPSTIGDTWTASFIGRRVGGTLTGVTGLRAAVVSEIAPSTFISNSFGAVTPAETDTVIFATATTSAGNQVRFGMFVGVTIGVAIDVTYRISGVQFEKSAIRTAYQANFSQYSITEAGVPSVHYIGFDGVDDGMVTSAIDFSATDAVTVFAGVRKLSDATQSIVLELTASSGGNTGTFALFAPSIAGQPIYGWRSRGTSTVEVTSTTSFASPNTSVFTGQAKISADSSVLRVNGVQNSTNISDQGTGNYANAILYIGRRGGASNPFNGNLYSLIIRGAQSTDGQITSTETWVNGKTGAY